jgi:hypothetical protein
MPTLKEALSATPWRDKEGLIRPNTANPATAPSLAVFQGNIYAYQFAANDEFDLLFHMPHDWIIDSDLYIHLHWGHKDASVAAAPNNDLTWDFYATYADRNGSAPFAAFPAEVSGQFVDFGMTIANYPQYCHVVTEILLGRDGATGSPLFDFSVTPFDADGLILAHLKLNSPPTGMQPFVFTADLHYQSDGSGDKNKDPNYDA